jgi:hypothetical protein
VFVVAATGFLLGCSQLLRSTDATFRQPGGADGGDASSLPPELSCFSESRAAPEQANVEFVTFNKQGTTTFRPADGGIELSNYIPVVGVSIVACSASDRYCDNPISSPVVTDDAGAGRLSIPGDFDGYYRLRRDDLFPTTYYPGAPSARRTNTYYLTLYPTSIEAYISGTLNVTLDHERGEIAVAVYDCAHLPLETATVETDAAFELAPYFPTDGPTFPTDNPTGARIFVNVAVGEATVTAHVNGRLLDERKVSVRPGSVAIVDFLGL